MILRSIFCLVMTEVETSPLLYFPQHLQWLLCKNSPEFAGRHLFEGRNSPKAWEFLGTELQREVIPSAALRDAIFFHVPVH